MYKQSSLSSLATALCVAVHAAVNMRPDLLHKSFSDWHVDYRATAELRRERLAVSS